MIINWKDDIKSIELIEKIYKYLYDTYDMDMVEVNNILNIHKQYNTFVVIDEEGMKGYARYNIKGTVAYIMDCIVIDGGTQTLRKLCRLGKDKFPFAITIRFERQLKKRTNMRHFKLNDFIKEVF